MEHIPIPRKRAPDAPRQELQDISDMGMHFSNLHDQDADESGERIDLTTGKRYDNSTDLGLGGLHEVDEDPQDADDNSQEDDAAAKWLRENDPNYGKFDA